MIAVSGNTSTTIVPANSELSGEQKHQSLIVREAQQQWPTLQKESLDRKYANEAEANSQLPGLLSLSFEKGLSEQSPTSKNVNLQQENWLNKQIEFSDYWRSLELGNVSPAATRNDQPIQARSPESSKWDQLEAMVNQQPGVDSNAATQDKTPGNIQGPQMIETGGGGSNGSSDFVSQDVVINADNDNRSTVTYNIPQWYDFERSRSQYQQDSNGNIQENDLVALSRVPPSTLIPTISWGFLWYKVTVSNNGKGRIEIWDSPDKKHMIPYNVQTTAYMQPDPEGNLRILPSFYMEGTHISEAIGDITVTISTEEITMFGNRQYDFKPIHVSVTPVALSLESRTDGTYFKNGNNSIEGVDAHFCGSIKLVTPESGKVDFVQFWDSFSNNLENGFAIERDGVTNLERLT